jgi:hypothetical protein
MRIRMIALSAALTMAALLPAGPAAAGRPDFSIGLGAGYFLPFGDWKAHRYAGVDQFTGNVTFQGDFEVRWSRLLGFAVNGGYAYLGTGEWEDYAALYGDAVDANASIFYIGALWKPCLWEDAYNELSLLMGINFSVPSGQETFGETTYDYDFMKDKMGYLFGIEYARDISRSTALMVSLPVLMIPSGVEYADGLKYMVTGLPLTAGVRFRF